MRLLVLISLFLFLLPQPILALEKGVQIPSEKVLPQLKSSNYKNVGWVKFQYRWDAPDQPVEKWVSDARKAGYKILISVAKKPTGGTLESYQVFMKNLAQKLKGQVEAYEIWNEPNLNDEWQGWGQINPPEYIKLLRAGAAGVKEGDPGAKVLSAGLAPLSGDYDDLKFFEEFVQGGGLDLIDGIGWHANVTKNIPPDDQNQEGFQRVKAALGKDKPVWITEFGWDRAQANISPETQTKYINDAFSVASSLGISGMIVWNFGFAAENPQFKSWDVAGPSSELEQSPSGSGGTNTTNNSSGKSSGKPNSEEQAVANLNQGLLPEGVSQSEVPKSGLFSNITSSLSGLINKASDFLNLPRFFSQSENIHQASLPEEVRPQDTDKAEDRLKGFLGGSTGFYGVTLPGLCQDNLGECEQSYEQANFPEEIKPITGN